MVVTVTGSQGGPGLFNGLAGPGTLIRYGEDSNDCNAMRLQFDAGRGTSLRLSQVGVQPEQLDAIFFTHMHSDHVEGFIDIVQLRWHNVGPRLDVVCSADAVSPLGHTLSCKKFAAHISDALIQAGEIAQRVTEDKQRVPWGPAELTHLITFEPRDEPQSVWISGDVRVSAIRSTQMHGHASYRVDTGRQRGHRRGRWQRQARAAARPLHLRPSREACQSCRRNRAFRHPSHDGSRDTKRFSRAGVLSPKHGG
jgi:ribonuclease Z